MRLLRRGTANPTYSQRVPQPTNGRPPRPKRRRRLSAAVPSIHPLPPKDVRRFEKRLAATSAERLPDPLLAAHWVYAAYSRKAA
jgi:hypothetical protein